MRHRVKRVLCLLTLLCILLALTTAFTLSTTASPSSIAPMITVGNKFIIVQTASGEIWGWGDNASGVLGTASSKETGTNITAPTQIPLPQNVTAVSVSAGFDHVLMLGSDGNVYAWGNNEAGQLGTSSGDTLSTPTLVAGLQGKSIVALAAGHRFSLALSEGGKVYSFGLNDKLQLGYEPTAKASATPTLIEAMSGVFVKQIHAGYDSVTAIDVDGKVYLWGSGSNSVLGLEVPPENHLPTALPEAKGALPVVCADLSANHSAYLQNDGTVGFMGLNKFGQYGNGETSDKAAVKFKVTDTASLGVSAIATSDAQTVLLTVDGKVYTAGAGMPNNADGSATATFAPLFAEEKAPIATAIAASYQNGAIIAQDGSIWTWGDNSCGQLGNGKVSEGQSTPVKVLVDTDSDLDMGQAPTVMGVPMKFTTSVPAPTYSVVIPSTIDVGELRQTNETDPNRHSLTKFTVEVNNVSNLFGEKEIQVSVKSGDESGIFCLKDNNGIILPFELFADEGAQAPIASGDTFAIFTQNGSVDAWIRIDQSKISQSGIYNGVLIFSYSVADVEQ